MWQFKLVNLYVYKVVDKTKNTTVYALNVEVKYQS